MLIYQSVILALIITVLSVLSLDKCVSAASLHLHCSGFIWRSCCVALHHIFDPVIVHADLGVDGWDGWIPATVTVPSHALQLAVTHHYTGIILEGERERE